MQSLKRIEAVSTQSRSSEFEVKLKSFFIANDRVTGLSYLSMKLEGDGLFERGRASKQMSNIEHDPSWYNKVFERLESSFYQVYGDSFDGSVSRVRSDLLSLLYELQYSFNGMGVSTRSIQIVCEKAIKKFDAETDSIVTVKQGASTFVIETEAAGL